MVQDPDLSGEHNLFESTGGKQICGADSSVRESIWLLTRWSGVQIPLGPYRKFVSEANE
jgi:hypothetical protein